VERVKVTFVYLVASDIMPIFYTPDIFSGCSSPCANWEKGQKGMPNLQ